MVIGDFNVKVRHHKGGDGDTISGHGLGKQNVAGERLVEFCDGNNMGVMNTWFEQPKRRYYTWTSPDGKHAFLPYPDIPLICYLTLFSIKLAKD